MENEIQFVANPTLVLKMKAEPDGRFRVRSVSRRWDILVVGEIASMMVLASTPMTQSSLVAEAEEIGVKLNESQDLVSTMIASGLLVDVVTLPDNGRRSEQGWRRADRYHRLTFDYPFHDYSEEFGFQFDVERMKNYALAEPDFDRFKYYPDCTEYPLMTPGTAFEHLFAANGSANWTNDFEALLSVCFGVTGYGDPDWNGARTLRRTSPSGGGRHPTEGYVLILDGLELPKGWYHIEPERPSLVRLPHDIPSSDDLNETYPGSVGRASFDPFALIVLTSRFSRNMYRYREPRTFRTVHMDVGHLSGSVMLLASAIGLQTKADDVTNAARTETHLGLDWLEEGAQYAIAVGLLS